MEIVVIVMMVGCVLLGGVVGILIGITTTEENCICWLKKKGLGKWIIDDKDDKVFIVKVGQEWVVFLKDTDNE